MQSAPNWTSHSAIAGAGAGLVSSIVTCPLDVVKTKLQAQRAARGTIQYLGILGTVKDILARDGIRGMYRGLGPVILGYLPTWAIYFALYDGIKSRFGENTLADRRLDALHHEHHQLRESWSLHIFAAMTAGATGTIVTNPLWMIKTRFMTQPLNERRYRHTLDAFITIYRTEGIGAFYRGLVPSLFGVSHVAVQFPLYEQLKVWFAERQDTPLSDLPSSTILLCSAISKMTASFATYPHEVVRTRLQVQLASSQSHHPLSFGSLVTTTRTLVHESGWRGLYKGLSVNLMRTVPNSGLTLLTYELIMRYLSGGETR